MTLVFGTQRQESLLSFSVSSDSTDFRSAIFSSFFLVVTAPAGSHHSTQESDREPQHLDDEREVKREIQLLKPQEKGCGQHLQR